MYWKLCLVFLHVLACVLVTTGSNDINKIAEFQLMTVATEATDGYLQFMKSANKYGYNVKVLGMGEKWEGGDIQRFPGGGQKILLLREAMEKVKDDKQLLVMFTDSYDVILTGGPDEVIKSFKKLDANIVFGAEGFVWPDESLAEKYPIVKPSEKRYLNSGGFVGFAPQIYELITLMSIEKDGDDQLYYTKAFLDEDIRKRLSIKLDVRSEIFQNLNGALNDVQLKFIGNHSYLYNTRTGNTPVVVHGNGPAKVQLNNLGNYLPDKWTTNTGCLTCEEESISLNGILPDDYPSVFIAVFLEHPTPFCTEFFSNLAAQIYPKEKISLFIHYADTFHEDDVKTFMDGHGLQYNNVELHDAASSLNEWSARNKALEESVKTASRYFWVLDGEVQLENKDTLTKLIERNRSVVAPMLVRPEKSWSNFWGELSNDGYYKRSEDYMDIILRAKRGLWNVPYISMGYLIHGHLIPRLLGSYADTNLDWDMAICNEMREQGIFMYIDNQVYYGHLVDSDDFNTTHLHNDMYQIFNNKYTWERKYLHRDYQYYLAPDTVVHQPCTDVFWVPLMTPIFCTHLIEEMENKNEWSSGKNLDPRLAGSYENVPTVDTHTNQIDWEPHWLEILKEYIGPIANKVFAGYYSEGRAVMNFVVRYKITEQDRLRPHADSSTYTVNVALNKAHLDFQGGGVNFLRYNCSITETRMGWFLTHPGRLTHQHEGLPTTGGTRYIMVSFIDP